MQKTSIGLIGLMAALAMACGAPPDGNSDGELEETDTTQQEIWMGTSSVGNLASVELWQYGDPAPACTGFFVSRHHILTASHCTSQWYSAEWFQVRVKTGYGTFKNLKDWSRSDYWVRLGVYLYPNATTDRGSDVALLYIEPQNQASIPSGQQILRISTAAPPTGQQLGIWGWGRRSAYGTMAGDLMTPPNGEQITVSGNTGRFFWANVNNNARTCGGDSGGPATRYQSGMHIAVGSHIGPWYVSKDDAYPCAEYGVRLDWAMLSDKASWIESTMRSKFGSSFSCARYGYGATAYMRCF